MAIETKQQGQGMSRQWVISGVVGAVAVVAAILMYNNAGNRASQQSPYAGVTLPEAITVDVAESSQDQLAAPEATTLSQAPIIVETALPAVADAGPVGSPREVQMALRQVGLYQGQIDGKVGPLTRQAVMQFQEANQLRADGKVGPKTWALLKPYTAKNTSSQTQGR